MCFGWLWKTEGSIVVSTGGHYWEGIEWPWLRGETGINIPLEIWTADWVWGVNAWLKLGGAFNCCWLWHEHSQWHAISDIKHSSRDMVFSCPLYKQDADMVQTGIIFLYYCGSFLFGLIKLYVNLKITYTLFRLQ